MIESDASNITGLIDQNWTGHWGLRFDPFHDPRTSYISTPEHEDILSRLAFVIQSRLPLGVLSGESGTGKTLLLNQLRSRLRAPGRRLAWVSDPTDEIDFVSALAESLRCRDLRSKDPQNQVDRWRSIESVVQVQKWQKQSVVVIVDSCDRLLATGGALVLRRLLDLDHSGSPCITLIVAIDEDTANSDIPLLRDGFPARLKRLTHRESVDYVNTMLRTGGRYEETFTPKALIRLHAETTGIPKLLSRLASSAMMAAARQGLEIITPQVVEELSRELSPFPRIF